MQIAVEGRAQGWPAHQFDEDIGCGRHATWEAFILGHRVPEPTWDLP
jgi:hypothetical protein